MILELSGHLNYNYHCGNVLWLWSVLLEDQNKISSKPGVLAFTSTLLSLKIPREKQQQQQPEGASQLLTSHIQHPGPEGCMLALGLTCILSKVSLWVTISLFQQYSHHGFLGHFRMERLLPSSHPFISGSSSQNYMTAFLSFKIMSRSDPDSFVFSLLCAF